MIICGPRCISLYFSLIGGQRTVRMRLYPPPVDLPSWVLPIATRKCAHSGGFHAGLRNSALQRIAYLVVRLNQPDLSSAQGRAVPEFHCYSNNQPVRIDGMRGKTVSTPPRKYVKQYGPQSSANCKPVLCRTRTKSTRA